MIQGTASSVGKSIMVTALCRIFKQDGFRVAPFKSQNMALNSFVTREGGEMGRAQVTQAEAAGIEPTVDMNPVLLKPEADAKSQVIVQGKVSHSTSAEKYYQHTPRLIKAIEESLNRLRSAYDVVVIEGAGSPAEINLKAREIVNMRIARMAQAPVLLCGDIDRGGVFASLVGTLELLDEDERDYIKAFIINKFRGDVNLLQPALDFLEKRTARPVLGVVPYFREISIAQEDSVYLDNRPASPPSADLDIAIVHLPHISNYDDFDPLEDEGCQVSYITQPGQVEGANLIIIPGTKSTMSDLLHLWQSGLAESIIRQAKKGTPVIGICGGYQMLGGRLRDPEGVEGPSGEMPGLGLLPVATVFGKEKTTVQVEARVVAPATLGGLRVEGYEIHAGEVHRRGGSAWFRVLRRGGRQARRLQGAVADDGRVFGTSIHGLFTSDEFRRGFLDLVADNAGSGQRRSQTEPATSFAQRQEESFDRLAAALRESLDMDHIYGDLFGTIPEGRVRR